MEEKIREYVLKRYPKTFRKIEYIKNYRGQVIRTKYIDIEPLITIKEKLIEMIQEEYQNMIKDTVEALRANKKERLKNVTDIEN